MVKYEIEMGSFKMYELARNMSELLAKQYYN